MVELLGIYLQENTCHCIDDYFGQIDGTSYRWLNFDGKPYQRYGRPACILFNGSKIWYQDDYLHRTGDNPAIISHRGDMIWAINGLLHREGAQPAIIFADGSAVWYKNGRLNSPNNLTSIVYSLNPSSETVKLCSLLSRIEIKIIDQKLTLRRTLHSNELDTIFRMLSKTLTNIITGQIVFQ